MAVYNLQVRMFPPGSYLLAHLLIIRSFSPILAFSKRWFLKYIVYCMLSIVLTRNVSFLIDDVPFFCIQVPDGVQAIHEHCVGAGDGPVQWALLKH